MNNEEPKKEPVQEVNPLNWKIPDCCREGWKSCPHVVKREKPAKRNVGL